MGSLFTVVLPVFFVIGFGYLAVWRGFFSQSGVDGLMKFTQKFAIPCLLFGAISQLDLSAHFDVRLLISFYTGALSGFTIGLIGARIFFKRPWEDCIAIGFIGLFSNLVLLGIPIFERAYGSEALASNFAIIAIHSPFCYLIGISAMEVYRNRGNTGVQTVKSILKAMFSNALIIGIFLGLFVNLTGLPIPQVLGDAIELIGRAALPAALFGLGGVLVQYRPEGDLRTVAFIVTVSLVIHPSVVWIVGRALELPDDAFRSAVMCAAMAPGINVYIFADMYGTARRVAASSVLLGTAMSILSVWVWLQILP